MQRRGFLAGAASPLFGCDTAPEITGGFAGVDLERGHLLRAGGSWPAPAATHRTRVVVAGGGVAGLAAARALRLNGRDDFVVLELEDSAGGNSRGGSVAGISCPLGAHYLPIPGDDASEVQDLLEELGVRQRVSGRWSYAERHLCHSPQERLFFNGQWQDGLLPLDGVGAATLVQYHKFATLVQAARGAEKWRIPVSKALPGPLQRGLKAITFATYLEQHGLTDVYLRWYLDYCCRDDYGAGIGTVSAWAGIHYFASRHGFHLESADAAASDPVLTWPQGNGWLTQRVAQPLGERLHTGQVVLRIAASRHGVEVDVFDTATQVTRRWLAERCVVALPLFVAARVLDNPPRFLLEAAAGTRYAPWLVANLHIQAALHDRPGPAPSWDNVIYGDTQTIGGLGYVDAMHQSLLPVRGPTVLTHYRALGDRPDGRQHLLDASWSHWRDLILADLGRAHPDLRAKTTRIEITRYGHAMAVPIPQRADPGHRPLASRGPGKLSDAGPVVAAQGALLFAHSDWVGYSVFEEAFTMGHAAGSIA